MRIILTDDIGQAILDEKGDYIYVGTCPAQICCDEPVFTRIY